MCEITIIIPVYNVEKYIVRCLNSALDQDFTHGYEILVIDDCGNDSSMAIVESVAASHPKGHLIRIVHHPENKGIGEATNTGIQEAKGKYVYLLDSDDWISLDCLRLLYDEAEKYQNEVTVAGYYRSSSDKIIRTQGFSYHHLCEPSAFLKTTLMGFDLYLARWNKLYLLSFLREHDIRCIHRMHEDDYFDFQVMCHCNCLSLIPQCTYYYFVNENSITTSKDSRLRKIHIHASIIQDIKSFASKNKEIPYLYDYYFITVFRAFYRIFQLVSNKEEAKSFSKELGHFLPNLPSPSALKLWKNRLLYIFYKTNDTFAFYYWVKFHSLKLANCCK